MIAHIFKGIGLQGRHRHPPTDGVVIDERLVIRSDASGPRSAKMVLQNPRVDFAVFEVARGGILREGLGYERNDVGVVLNVQPDHLGLRGVDTLEQLADVKAVIVEAVPLTVRGAQRRRSAGPGDAAALLGPGIEQARTEAEKGRRHKHAQHYRWVANCSAYAGLLRLNASEGAANVLLTVLRFHGATGYTARLRLMAARWRSRPRGSYAWAFAVARCSPRT